MESLLSGQQESFDCWLTKFQPRQPKAKFAESAEILPGWNLRLFVHPDGQGYDLVLRYLTDKQCGYVLPADESGIIRQSKAITAIFSVSFYLFGHLASILSRMNLAWSIARSTAHIFAGLGLSLSMAASLRADKTVAAKRIAYFRSSVIGNPLLDFAGRGRKAILHQLADKPEPFTTCHSWINAVSSWPKSTCNRVPSVCSTMTRTLASIISWFRPIWIELPTWYCRSFFLAGTMVAT
jgi:hypothetical protein